MYDDNLDRSYVSFMMVNLEAYGTKLRFQGMPYAPSMCRAKVKNTKSRGPHAECKARG